MAFNHYTLWAPDVIKESNGIACGDTLSVSAYIENGKLYFSFSGNACSIAFKVASYLENTFSGIDEYLVKRELERLREKQYLKSELWISDSRKERKNCVDLPISLLYGIFDEKKSSDNLNNNDDVLACDACVSTKPINWKPEIQKNEKTTLKNVGKKIVNMDSPNEIELQKLGLCILNKQQQREFQCRLTSATMTDVKLIKKLRLAALYYNNSLKYDIGLDSKIYEIAMKQVVSLAVANEEIKKINEYIEKSHLKIDAVKGEKTNKYYPEKLIRTHMDFDYLSSDFGDAFILISYLINERGFKMVIGGSVPFSIKSVLNIMGDEVLTGHIHLEKILQDRYQVVVDINMGGFPLGRTGIIQCNNIGKVELEDLICITVSHLFKHEHAFMKDINDLYYLLESDELDCNRLLYKIDLYRLSDLFSIAYNYLKKNTDLKRELKCNTTYTISEKRMKMWPYSRKAHFYIKAKDMLNLNRMQYGMEIGTMETINQICGNIGEIKANKYRKLCPKMNKRTYLYPVVIFNKYIADLNINCLEKIENLIMSYKHLLVLPIGIFIIQNEEYSAFNRDLLNSEVEYLLKQLSLSNDDCNMQYVMEARKDTWLY